MIGGRMATLPEAGRAPAGGTASHCAPPRGFADRYLGFLAFVLSGYALNGRGFAYIGMKPLFIGEVALVVGLVALCRSRGWTKLLWMPPAAVLVLLAVCGAAQTVPYLSADVANAMRDAAVWGYSAFAWIVAGLLITDTSRLARLIGWYRRLVPRLLLGIPVVAVIYEVLWPVLPRWPGPGAGGGVPIFFFKAQDALIHFSGILAFWVSGFGGRVSWPWLMLLAVNVAVMGVIDRAGMLAFVLVMGICLALWPRTSVPWRIIGLMLGAVLVLWITDLHVEIPMGKSRELSFEQILTNIGSVTGDTGHEGLDRNKEWRLDWWKTIVGYTLHGEYFWTGKGFGINLADDDGFQVLSDSSVRNPHSVHMTFLARGGVPGITLWVLAQGLWGVCIFRSFLLSRIAGDRDWLGLFLFLGSYWVACLTAASFDIFLEGPVGGAWFWSIYGAGLAAIWIHRYCPEAIRSATPTFPRNTGNSYAQPDMVIRQI